MDGQGGPRGRQVGHCDPGGTMVADVSHGWRWVDRSGWTPEEEVDNVKKAINGKRSAR